MVLLPRRQMAMGLVVLSPTRWTRLSYDDSVLLPP